jgi:hypothetical protein
MPLPWFVYAFTATFERTTTGRPETVVSRFEVGSTSQP